MTAAAGAPGGGASGSVYGGSGETGGGGTTTYIINVNGPVMGEVEFGRSMERAVNAARDEDGRRRVA